MILGSVHQRKYREKAMKKPLDRHCLDLGMGATEEEFQRYALAWLQQHVGFDGLVWGQGMRMESGAISIQDYLLEGRPHQLVNDYAQVAAIDRVTQRFSIAPHRPQNINVHSFYNAPESVDLLAYLEHYRVRHLFLVGTQQTLPDALNWIVLYREDSGRAFDETKNALIASAISTVLHGAYFRRTADAILHMLPPFACPNETAAAIHLTGRQQQILDRLRTGLPNKAIARDLAISENTLKTHLSALYRSLNVTSRVQAIIRTRTDQDGHGL
jgi:DNA-binding CsgD family transcriptional regulator